MMKNPYEQQQILQGIKHIIVVGSGKGGVGKSTVALNLALALKQEGDATVGLMDADLYGPSIPSLTGTRREKMLVKDDKLLPVSKYGIQISSIGYLVDEESALVWRGPMLFKAIEQFLRDVEWGALDYLIVDLPPGTGDVALTLAQKTPISGGIAVTTPQNLALMDMMKAVDMFKEVQIPLLGVVENMSYFHPDGVAEAIHLFPKGQLHTFLKNKNIDCLAEIPFQMDIGLSADSGIPTMISDSHSKEARCFLDLAKKVREKIKTSR